MRGIIIVWGSLLMSLTYIELDCGALISMTDRV